MSTKLLIVGGVAGGATAAARARRIDENAEIVLFERGPYISFANCGLPYYVGQVITQRGDLLVTTKEDFAARYNVDIRDRTEVVSIDRKEKAITAANLETGTVYKESYDRLILSPGAEPVRPPLPGIDLDGIYPLRNIPDSDRIMDKLDQIQPKAAVVVGGGFIGLEMAENLAHRGLETTVVEMADQIMAPLDPEMAGMVQAHMESQGVQVHLQDPVQSFSAQGDRIETTTKSGRKLVADLVILSIGVRPEVKLAREAGLAVGSLGGISVDMTLRTSDPEIFAVGDAVEIRDLITGQPTLTALAGPANRQARVAADNAMGRRTIFKGTIGTSIVKVFDLTVAATGANEKNLTRYGIPYLVNYTHGRSHTTYFPGATEMALKVVFSPAEGRLLGAQIVGRDGVDKRIDVLATAIMTGLTVFDLEELELAYAPPFGAAKDPINIAGFAAANILKGDMDIALDREIEERMARGEVLIDLRGPDELEAVPPISGALHIPLPQLRGRLSELDPKKSYVPYCGEGMRGYIAHRILVQHGFSSRNLSGGLKLHGLGVKKSE